MISNLNDIKIYKDLHKNQDCVILTCGPSLNEYNKDKILNFIKNKIVICIKETIIEFKDQCHFFFSNNNRHRQYEFNSNTKKIYTCHPWCFDKTNECYTDHLINNYDLILVEDINFHTENKQLLKVKNFDDFSFDKNIKRPWGPGILYETVFYFLNYMGIKNIFTIGWDLIDCENKTALTHYFDNFTDNNYNSSKRYNSNINFRNEFILINMNIIYFYNYLKSKNTNLFVVGKKSFVCKDIPRILL